MSRSIVRRPVIAVVLASASLPITAGAYATSPDPESTRNVISLYGRSNGAEADQLFVRAADYNAGATINLFRTGRRYQPREFVKQTTANDFGNARFVVLDLNGRAPTQYRAVIRPSEGEYLRAVSNRRVVR